MATALVLTLLLIVTLATQKTVEPAPPLSALDEQSLKRLETGDLVFRRQSGLMSEIARKLSPNEKRFSHVGLVISGPKVITVIHSVSDEARGVDGVVSEDIGTFLSESSDWSFYRVAMTLDQRAALRLHSEKLLQANIPFDDNFDLSTDDRLYCTELVAKIFNSLFEQPLFEAGTTLAGKAYLPLDALYLSSAVKEVTP